MKIGFIVNPYAGMGGAVGLKGTDGKINEAIARGATPESPKKAIRFLSEITRTDLTFFTVSGKMGEEELKQAGYSGTCLYDPARSHPNQEYTTKEDTIQACQKIRDADPHIIIFCGGDGTAQDVYSCIGTAIPILGIPTGVKIYSGVFATTPESAAHLISVWNGVSVMDGEIMDVDEEAYRQGELNVRLFGYAKIPSTPIPCQSSKQVSVGDDRRAIDEIALFIVEMMRDDTLYLLGAGTTTKAIADRLGIDHTLLGVDAIYQRKMIGRDLSEDAIHTLLNSYDRVKIILSPIGAQGFILGRGNQQISRRVIERAGVDSLIVIASEAKLKNTKSLYIDTGDPELNKKFGDSVRVICGYRMAIRSQLNQDTTLSGYELSG